MASAAPGGGLPAKRVGKYELGAVIGKGSFSTVRLGVDTATGQKYAVKVMAKEQLVRQQLEEKVRREVAVLKALRHPYIVQLHDVLQTSSSVYLVLEFIEGGELFKAIVDNKRLPESQARRLFQQLILAIRYCHHQRVAHRDLKPENVLISASGDIKVNDFGLARLMDDSTDNMMTTKCGSPNYIAPEVIRDPRYNGFTADIWACGIILYVMISGKHAFTDPNREGLFAKILRGEHRAFDANFSEGCKDLVSKILVVDLAKRYQISDILQHPWFLEGFDPALLPETERSVEVTQQDTENAVQRAHEDFASPDAAMPAGGGEVRQLAYVAPGGPAAAATDVSAALKGQGMQVTGGPSADGATAQLRAFVTRSAGLLTLIVDVAAGSVEGASAVVTVSKGRGDAASFEDACKALLAALGAKVRPAA